MAAKKTASSDPSSDLRQQIDLLIERAPKLRAAGVTSLCLENISVTLAPPPVEPADLEPASAPSTHIDPLKDPATFPGGRIPGYRREHEPKD